MAKNKEQNVVEEEKLEEQVEDLQTDTDAEEKQVDDTEDLTILKEEVGELKEALQRERAEFANFRKRTIQEKSDIQSYVTGQILGDLLPAFDSFDQLFATRAAEGEQSDANKFLEGVELIKKQLFEVLNKNGVEGFDPAGESYDANTMEALSSTESEDVTEATVAQVYQKGYSIAGRVIRAARVAVLTPAKKEAEAPAAESNEPAEQQEGEQ